MNTPAPIPVILTTAATNIDDARRILADILDRAAYRPATAPPATTIATGEWRFTITIPYSDGYGVHTARRIIREANLATIGGRVAPLEDVPCLCGAARSEHFTPWPDGVGVQLSPLGRECAVTGGDVR